MTILSALFEGLKYVWPRLKPYKSMNHDLIANLKNEEGKFLKFHKIPGARLLCYRSFH
jgi:hypothetical protein